MNYYFISNTALFKGISPQEIERMFSCLHFRTAGYNKGETILRRGGEVADIGLVLSGTVQVESSDLWGNKSILALVEPGGVFAESYACLQGEPLMVDVMASEKCQVLFINIRELLNPCEQPCFCHASLIKNLLFIGARKNIGLAQRISDTSPKTIRGRLISYFSRMVLQQGSSRITVPFDRQQLADYLGVDRSALSKELGRMKAEGLLDFERSPKNRFTLFPEQWDKEHRPQ